MKTHLVIGGSYARYMDPDEEWTLAGFATAEAAREYARRLIRSQVEHFRREGAPGGIAAAYRMFGDYAATEGLDAAAWLEHCIAEPASRHEDTDYASLRPT